MPDKNKTKDPRDKHLSDYKLTGRGKGLVFFLPLSGFFALFFQDFFILGVFLIVLGLFAFDFLTVRRVVGKSSEYVDVVPFEIRETRVAGGKISKDLKIMNESSLEMEFDCPLESCEISSENDEGDLFSFVFSPDLAGEYECEGFDLNVSGRLGLFEGVSIVPVDFGFTVRPRVLAAAMEAARFLVYGDRVGGGEQPTDLKGRGLEYAGSREYVPGDDISDFDWKATARLGKPIVKEFYLEGSENIHVIYEAIAPDSVSLDKLSSSFLNTVVSIAKKKTPIGLTVHDGKDVKLHSARLDPNQAVSLAIKHALETVELEVEELYSVLEPVTARDVKSALETLDEESAKNFLSAELENFRKKDNGVYENLKESLGSDGEKLNVVFNSSLSRDLSPVLELGDLISSRGSRFHILQPSQPWENVDDLEESYRIFKRYSRVYDTLEKRNFSISTSFEDLMNLLTEGQARLRSKV